MRHSAVLPLARIAIPRRSSCTLLLALIAITVAATSAIATSAVAAVSGVAPSTIPTKSTRVSYLAGASIYIEAGRFEGFLEGDTLAVTRGGMAIATLRVAFLTSHRGSCDTLSVNQEMRVGDTVWWIGRSDSAAASITSLPAGGPGGLEQRGDSLLAGSPIVPTAAMPTREASPFHGRLGARLMAVQNHGAASVGFTQPALDVRLNGSNFRGAPLDLGVDVRTRRTTTTLADGRLISEAVTRVYRASLSLHDRSAHYRLTVGRQTSPTLASVSLFDGALAEYTGTRWSGGLFSGSQPDPAGDRFSRTVIEHGGFFELRSRPLERARWSAAFGGVTSTDSGQTNRDFLFVQTYYQAPKVSGMLAQELDLNRGWKRTAGEAALQPTSTFLLVRYQATRPLAMTVGYDNRRNVRLYRDRLTPETEFDDRFRAGGWIGAAYDLGSHVRLDGDLRLRSGAGADRSHAWSSGAELLRLPAWSATLRARYAEFASISIETRLTSLGLGVDPLAAMHLDCSGGQRRSRELLAGSDETVDWISGDLDVAVARRWLVNMSFERDRSDFDHLTQEYVALSWRF